MKAGLKINEQKRRKVVWPNNNKDYESYFILQSIHKSKNIPRIAKGEIFRITYHQRELEKRCYRRLCINECKGRTACAKKNLKDLSQYNKYKEKAKIRILIYGNV